MSATRVILRCGRGSLSVVLPRRWRARVLTGDAPAARQPAAVDARIRRALDQPLNAPGLEVLARGARSALIAVTDLTRPCPDHLFVPHLLDRLIRAGISPSKIRVMIATGMHRPLSPGEIIAKLGKDVARRVKVVNHVATASRSLVSLGTGPLGAPIVLDAAVRSSDLVLATGLVEPHLYAGFSGGAKTLAIGGAGEATIGATHSPLFLDHPGVRLGRIDGNPFQDLVLEAGRRARLSFVLNAVLDPEGGIASLAAGEPEAVLHHLAGVCRRLTFKRVRGPFDIVLGGVGEAKGVNVYQASRLPTYLALSQQSVLAPGAPIVVAARCPEGVGQGLGEQRFARALGSGPVRQVLADLRSRPFLAGEQRAYVCARVLEHHPIIWAGIECPDAVRAMRMSASPDLAGALAQSGLPLDRPARVLVLPDGFAVQPFQPASAEFR